MPKSLWFPDDEFSQLVTLAKQAGFRVSRGRGSQLRSFVMTAANTACSGLAGTRGKNKGVQSDLFSVGDAGSNPPANR